MHHQRLRPEAGLRRDRLSRRSGLADRGRSGGADPAGVTNTWNDGPVAGAGAQLNAQPMFHAAAVVVNVGLVQFPCCCGDVRRTRAGPAAAADDVDASWSGGGGRRGAAGCSGRGVAPPVQSCRGG